MKIGIHLQVGPRWWSDLTIAADQAGFESVWLPEHLIMPVTMTGKPGSPHEGEPPIAAHTPAWDPFMQMAYLAAQTDRIRFGTNVFNIGLRHPFITARSITTAELLTGGRVEFGIGASWLSEEWDAMQLPFETRGRRVDESIRILQRLFTEETIEHHGQFFDFAPVGFEPKPVQKPWPPMHIGGDSPAAIRRAATLGDGWLPMAQTLETLPGNIATLQHLREDAGREGRTIVTAFRIGGNDIDTLERCRDAGVDRVLVVPWTGSDRVGDIKRFGEEVLPRFHRA